MNFECIDAFDTNNKITRVLYGISVQQNTFEGEDTTSTKKTLYEQILFQSDNK